VGSTSGTFENGVLRLDYEFLNTTLEARLEGDELSGTYRNRRPQSRPMAFRARRFTPTPAASSEAQTPTIDGSWEMYRTSHG
jgi:hypothetical protein